MLSISPTSVPVLSTIIQHSINIQLNYIVHHFVESILSRENSQWCWLATTLTLTFVAIDSQCYVSEARQAEQRAVTFDIINANCIVGRFY